MKVINDPGRITLVYDNDVERRAAELLAEDYKRLCGAPHPSQAYRAPLGTPALAVNDTAQITMEGKLKGVIGTILKVHPLPQNGTHVYDFLDKEWRGRGIDPKTGREIAIVGRTLSVAEKDLVKFDVKTGKPVGAVNEDDGDELKVDDPVTFKDAQPGTDGWVEMRIISIENGKAVCAYGDEGKTRKVGLNALKRIS